MAIKQINIHEAKTNLSQLLSQALYGEEIVITKEGKPMVRMISVEEPISERVLGFLKILMTLS